MQVVRIENDRSAFKILAEKRPLGNSRCRCEDKVRMDLKKWVSIREIGQIRHRIGIIGEPL